MSAFVINPYRFAAPDPEAGLTLTSSFAVGTNIQSGDVTRTQNAVFAADFTVPSSPSGLIYEQGGSGSGCYVGFRSGNQFVIRAGSGGANAPTTSGSDYAALYLTSGQPSGTGTLVWEFDIANKSIRAWWNGASLGTATSTGTWTSSQWAGANAGEYFDTSSDFPAGEVATALAATGISDLRYYNNQLVTL